jgi:hypothetical protein
VLRLADRAVKANRLASLVKELQELSRVLRVVRVVKADRLTKELKADREIKEAKGIKVRLDRTPTSARNPAEILILQTLHLNYRHEAIITAPSLNRRCLQHFQLDRGPCQEEVETAATKGTCSMAGEVEADTATIILAPALAVLVVEWVAIIEEEAVIQIIGIIGTTGTTGTTGIIGVVEEVVLAAKVISTMTAPKTRAKRTREGDDRTIANLVFE